MVLGRQLLVLAAALALVRAATITVPYDDPSIEYSGSGWGPDIFEIRPGIDPDTGGGALDSTCKLGDNSTTTPAFGNNFSFSFKGASVSLVLETRADHGEYEIDLDGVIVKKTGYSEAPHCGVVWTSDTLDGRKTHKLVVTYVARDERSPWPNNYLQLFKILYDDGPGKPPSSSTSTPGNHQTDPPSQPSSGDSAPVGAIVGGVVGGLAVIALIGVTFFLFRRRRRESQRNSGSYPGFVEANALTTPTPFDPNQFPRQAPTPTQHARREKESLSAPPVTVTGSSSGPSNSHSTSQSGELSQPDVERIARRLATLVQPPRYEA